MPRMSSTTARTLHGLAEDIYEALDREGFWDDDAPSRGRTRSSGRGSRRRQISLPRKKRKASASQKKYGRMFKKLAPRFKKKNGSWKKDGFKRCVRAAHRACR